MINTAILPWRISKNPNHLKHYMLDNININQNSPVRLERLTDILQTQPR